MRMLQIQKTTCSACRSNQVSGKHCAGDKKNKNTHSVLKHTCPSLWVVRFNTKWDTHSNDVEGIGVKQQVDDVEHEGCLCVSGWPENNVPVA